LQAADGRPVGPGSILRPALPAVLSLCVGLLALASAGTAAATRPPAGIRPAAVAFAEEPPRLGSERAMGLYLEGSLAASRGEVEAAYQAFYHAYLIEPRSPAVITHLASAVLHLGDTERAVSLATEGLAVDSTDARLHALRATALTASGNLDAARYDLEKAAHYDSTDADYAYQLAREYERIDRLEDARRLYERAVELGNDDPETRLRHAVVLGRLGRHDEALPLLDEAERSGADLPTLSLTRAWILDELDRRAEAVSIYEQFLALHPDDVTVRRRLVNGLMALGRDRDALPHARLMYDAGPGLAEGRVLAGIYLRLRQPGQARDVALDLRRRSPGELEVAEFTVTLLLRQGEYEAAVAEAGQFATEAPESLAAHLLLAMALSGAKRSGEAEAALARAEAVAPDSADAQFALGRAYFATANYARAETLFSRALSLGADSAAAWYEIAGARERRADVDGAEAAIRRVVERWPDSPQALNFLGYLYADYDRNLPEAVRLIRRALELDPRNGFIMDSLGWAYFRMGELDSARVELERALATSGEDPTILEHLGDVLTALDRPAVAKEKYRRALELGPENPDGLREKLRRLP
jgi:tetratricopeptide (TPR) repeat protein